MPTVLVVDDSPFDRRVVDGLLKREAGLEWLVEYAEDGREALNRMRDFLPDVVVTDLQMPEMDGLELVTTVANQYADTPVILMTGEGSEAVALAALDRGAASYIPKDLLADRFISTITQVLETCRAERGQKKVSQCVFDSRLSMQLENDPEIVRSVVSYFTQIMEDMSFGDKAERVHVAVALEEALLNAMLHGNLELDPEEVRKARAPGHQESFAQSVQARCRQTPYSDRHVLLQARLTPKRVLFSIRDQGPGFQIDHLPERGDPKMLEESTGRGVVLMKSFMDEVSYDSEKGELLLAKRCG